MHRGVHTLSVEATDAYEAARERVGRFVGTDDPHELVFVRNATEGLNLVAACWGRANLEAGRRDPGDRARAPLEPGALAARRPGRRRDASACVPLTEHGTVDMDALRETAHAAHESRRAWRMPRTCSARSTRWRKSPSWPTPSAPSSSSTARRACPHVPTDVAALGVDFLAFSGHKMLGPMGIGGLWGRRDLLEAMPPFLGGGGMIREVFEDHATWAPLPEKFDAGTPSVADSIGLAAAVDYLDELGMDNVRAHEMEITGYALERLASLPDLTVYGPRDARDRDGRRLVQPGRRASARCGHDSGRGRRGGARGAPLLPAAASHA